MSETFNARLRALIAHWNSEGQRCYHIAHERRNGNPDKAIMAQAVRFWECARELEELVSGRGVSGEDSAPSEAQDPRISGTREHKL